MTEPAAKRVKSSSPTSIVTWNCNGFASRSLQNAEELKRLVRETNQPDCLCLQEVRLKATGDSQRGKPQASECDIVQPTLTTVFGDYDAYWSLADTRYAGTLTLLHKRLKFAGETAYTPQAAIDILLKMYGVARKDVGLPEKPESPKKKAVQTSMKSFFAPKTNNNKTTATAVQADHNCDGRFQFFSFQDMDLIQTYVPNNGMKEESFQRRRQWDQDMLDFFQARDKILQHARDTDRLLLWCGDMNVAHDHRDGTHWERRPSEELYEWWTDESKCLASSAKKTDPNRSPDDRGMPSFTPAERRRFANLLQTANLVDVWRDLHPDGSSRSDLKQWDRPEWTWRGHLGKGGVRSKYEGKGQRLDYFLLSPYNKDSIKACDILGYGSQREGLFCGSDHCASVLVLKKNNNNNKEDEKA